MQNSFSLWVIATALILWGCSSDSGSNADGTQTVQSLSDLGECTTSKEGSVAWIESENKGYICSMGNWVYDAQIINPSIGDASTQLGTITDARDGQQYKTVEFDGVTWLAQNLNYAIANTDSISSKCYMDDPANCATFGRLYSRAAAALPNICPDGFEIVDAGTWKWLKGRYESRMLKSTVGWTYWNDAINPNDATGFGLQASGYCANYNECSALEYEGRYWSLGGDRANEYVAVYYNRNDMVSGLKPLSPMDHNAIRCVSRNYGSCSPENAGEIKSLVGKRYYCDGTQWLSDEYMASIFTSVYDYPSKEFFFNPAINYGTMTDPRDGQTYKTTTIGSQVWMAENLNYVTVGGVADDGVGSQCVLNSPHYCNISGRIYSWDAAKNVCPEGWRLPSRDDFELLLSTVSDNVFYYQGDDGTVDIEDNDAEKLKSQVVALWSWSWNGTDDYGFSAIPDYGQLGGTTFWSSSVYQVDAGGMTLYRLEVSLSAGIKLSYTGSDAIDRIHSDGWTVHPVRCIKN